MMNILKFSIVLSALAIMFNVMGCDGSSAHTPEATVASSVNERCPHGIKLEKCPFCKPELIEADGMCGEHGVAEALCHQCRPYLKEAFRTKGDWCGEHSAPESQCVKCNPDLLNNRMPGQHGVKISTAEGSTPSDANGCPHGIESTKCPFCTPSLIADLGECKGHNVAEALCVKCRPYLEQAFKAAGDWCNGHAVPESQCALCNPELAKPG